MVIRDTLLDMYLCTANFKQNVLTILGFFKSDLEKSYTSIESLYKTLLESGIKTGKAPSTV